MFTPVVLSPTKTKWRRNWSGREKRRTTKTILVVYFEISGMWKLCFRYYLKIVYWYFCLSITKYQVGVVLKQPSYLFMINLESMRKFHKEQSIIVWMSLCVCLSCCCFKQWTIQQVHCRLMLQDFPFIWYDSSEKMINSWKHPICLPKSSASKWWEKSTYLIGHMFSLSSVNIKHSSWYYFCSILLLTV